MSPAPRMRLPSILDKVLLISTVSFPVLVETLPFTSPPLRVIESVPVPPT